MKCLLTLFFASSLLFADEHVKSRAEIQQELSQAQSDLKKAQEMFNPWYTGPLLASSASMMPPGMANIQPYLFVVDNYAAFNSNRHTVHAPNIVSLNPNLVFLTGVTSWLDIAGVAQGASNWRSGDHATYWGDTSITLGFFVADETLHIPKMKIAVKEVFPSGLYQRFTPSRASIQSTGGGSYQTTFAFNLSKLFYITSLHPTNIRLNLNYTIPAKVHVHGFNTYGGGFGTNGYVVPGQSFLTDLGIEVSLTQKIVLASDFVYTYTARSTFKGTAGLNSDGTPAVTGTKSSDQLSIAPALEYNITPNWGVIAGSQIAIIGRNSSKFISGIFSFTGTFSF